jgi:hypothetical protein
MLSSTPPKNTYSHSAAPKKNNLKLTNPKKNKTAYKSNNVQLKANQWDDVIFYEVGVTMLDQPEEETAYYT